MHLHRAPLAASPACSDPSVRQGCTLVEEDKCCFSFEYWSVVCSGVPHILRSHCRRRLFLNITFK